MPPGRPGPIIDRIAFTRLNRGQQGLSWITQSIHISYLYCRGQGGRHLSLQPLPEHGAMSAPLSKPSNGLRLNDPLTGIAYGTPSCQIISVSFIIPLPAHGELLRAIWPLVCAGEVADKASEKSSQQSMLFSGKLFSQIRVGPSSICGIYPHRPSAISAGDMH